MKTNALSPGTQVPLSLALLGVSGASHMPCSLWELVTEPGAPWDSWPRAPLGGVESVGEHLAGFGEAVGERKVCF